MHYPTPAVSTRPTRAWRTCISSSHLNQSLPCPFATFVLCLSVFHQWHQIFGHQRAQQILHTLGTKARWFLFFEPASQQSKYGPVPPDYDDRDECSIVDYNLGMLGGLFCGKKVEFVAATPASHGERLRYLFSIQMTLPQLQANNGIRPNPEQILRQNMFSKGKLRIRALLCVDH